MLSWTVEDLKLNNNNAASKREVSTWKDGLSKKGGLGVENRGLGIVVKGRRRGNGHNKKRDKARNARDDGISNRRHAMEYKVAGLRCSFGWWAQRNTPAWHLFLSNLSRWD